MGGIEKKDGYILGLWRSAVGGDLHRDSVPVNDALPEFLGAVFTAPVKISAGNWVC
jgi:hypothetical protein